jgi:DNA replication protein DnaC
VTTMTDTAAHAAIGAAARELHLPTVRAEATRLAEIAQRNRLSYLALLAEILSAEVDDRSDRRRERRIREAKFPRVKRLADFRPLGYADGEPGHDRNTGERLLSGGGMPSFSSATAARGRAICSSASASPPASRAGVSAKRPRG